MKYFTKENFTGDVVPHYKVNRAIMTKEAALALSKAQKKFLEKGYSIVIYDAYRPSSSVKYFVEWMIEPNNMKRKKYHYPYIEKKIDMKDIYINSISGHSRGSTIDLTGRYAFRKFSFRKNAFRKFISKKCISKN